MWRTPQPTAAAIWSNVAWECPVLQRMPWARQARTKPSAPGNSGATVAVPIVIYGVMPRLHQVRARLLTKR